MIIAPAANSASGLALFLARLIQLEQLSSVLLLYDDAGRNLIANLPKITPSRADVAWINLNINEKSLKWKYLAHHEQLMIISSLQIIDTFSLIQLYYTKVLNHKSKNIILLNQNDSLKTANMNTMLELLVANQINAIFLEVQHDSVDIYAWNPPEYKNDKKTLMLLSEIEFLSSSQENGINSTYTGLFFNNVLNMRGRKTEVLARYDPTNVFNVIDFDGRKGLSGIEMNIINVIGELIRSKVNYIVIQPHEWYTPIIESEIFSEYMEKSYYSQVSAQPLDLKIADIDDISE